MKSIYEATILMVDDNQQTAVLVSGLLRRAGYQSVHYTLDSRQTLALVGELKPDMVILDLFMPPPDGFDLLDQLALRPNREEHFPVLVLTADDEPGTKVKAVSKGAKEFLTKPVDRVDLLNRTRRLIEWRFLNQKLASEKARRHAAERRIVDLDSEREVLDRLATVARCLDANMAQRAERIANLAGLIAAELGLDGPAIARLRSAARLYDFGMLAVPEALRNAEDQLATQDYRTIERHTVLAGEMFAGSRCAGLEMAREIAVSHHERWDGTGFPFGLRAAGIPLPARLVAVAHAYDALFAGIGNESGQARSDALAEVARQSGFAFDPDVVKALIKALATPAVPEPQEEASLTEA